MRTKSLISIINGEPVTTSLLVAFKFNKRHADVVRTIERLILANAKLRSLYQSASYKDEQRKMRPMYIMNKDAFTLLVMGFTGQQALDFKLDYINAFNSMEQKLTTISEEGIVSNAQYKKQVEQTQYWKEIAERSIKSMDAMNETIKQCTKGVRPDIFYYLTDEYYSCLINSFVAWLHCENQGVYMSDIRDAKLIKRFEAARLLYFDQRKRVPLTIALSTQHICL